MPLHEYGATPSDPLKPAQYAPVPPNSPFVLVHNRGYEGSWECVTQGDRQVLVPRIERLILLPGTNGVASPSGPDADPRDALEGMHRMVEREGRVVIDGSAVLVRVPARDPRSGVTGHYHMTTWETIQPPANSSANATIQIDKAAEYTFALGQVRDGRIGAPHESVLARMRASMMDEYERAKTTLNPEIRDTLVARASAKLDGFDKAIRPWEPEPEHEPKPEPKPNGSRK
jgi:hypothetical protein